MCETDVMSVFGGDRNLFNRLAKDLGVKPPHAIVKKGTLPYDLTKNVYMASFVLGIWTGGRRAQGGSENNAVLAF